MAKDFKLRAAISDEFQIYLEGGETVGGKQEKYGNFTFNEDNPLRDVPNTSYSASS